VVDPGCLADVNIYKYKDEKQGKWIGSSTWMKNKEQIGEGGKLWQKRRINNILFL
jgi:hypothetical protein